MESQQLKQAVEDAVKQKLSACEPFTTADISHPIIKANPSVRHYQVRQIINEIESRGDICIADFVTSTINVYPDGPGKAVQARLWHPDGYDPDQYNGNKKVLIRGGQTDSAPSENVLSKVTAPKAWTPTGSPAPIGAPGTVPVLMRPCKLQSKETTLNIPTKVVKAAGWKYGDSVSITTKWGFPGTSGIGGGIKAEIRKANNGNKFQKVDREGRIRLHGQKARAVAEVGQTISAHVIKVNGETIIHLV